MCGIVGTLGFSPGLRAANDALRNRGPDGDGEWQSDCRQVSLGHTRLSLVDLSETGAQPMISLCERYVISFNGEIYNHKDLRDRLVASGVALRGSSDTEVLLESIARFGLREVLVETIGMFAFGLWDREKQSLVIGRDRVGIKPLYFTYQSGVFAFASEMKGLRALPNLEFSISESAVSKYFQFRHIPAPHSIFEQVQKLKSGCILEIKLSDLSGGPSLAQEIYYCLKDTALKSVNSRNGRSQEDLLAEVESILLDSIKLRMQADVPVGCFLSGGIDSSLMVSLMQQASGVPISTFSVGYADSPLDESRYASETAKSLGCDHHELIMGGGDALNAIEGFGHTLDEPFSDFAAFPTYLLSKFAKNTVKGCLSGDGGDELFCGYSRYLNGFDAWRSLQEEKWGLRRKVLSFLSLFGEGRLDQMYGLVEPVIPKSRRIVEAGYKIHKLNRLARSGTLSEYYVNSVSFEAPLKSTSRSSMDAFELCDSDHPVFENLDPREALMLFDQLSYIPEEILTKLDRSTMGAGLEGRVPFLDHRVIEFSWSVGLKEKIEGGVGKQPLRMLLENRLDPELLKRPKTGFNSPLRDWLRSDLKDWADTLINAVDHEDPYLCSKGLQDMWVSHLRGENRHTHILWNVLMFQMWRNKWAQ